MNRLPDEWADLLPLAFGVLRGDPTAVEIENDLRRAALAVREGVATPKDEEHAQVFRRLQYMLLCRNYGKTVEKR